MLAIFNKTVAHPPQELSSPVSSMKSAKKPNLREEILKDFLSSNPDNSSRCPSLMLRSLLTFVLNEPTPSKIRVWIVQEHQRSHARHRSLPYPARQGPYPADQDSDGRMKLHWGVVDDGSLVISDDLEMIKTSCGKSFAPFPTGCIFHSEGGLMSFEHPMNKVKPMPRVDSEGVMCEANFKVDVLFRINTMPRVGSEAN
ncbi:hypothetical protein NE237_000323 [Protea cynaroides]|uniref:DUF3700 domain-containing protein n=1 Tax=Protea cynaroides TaxID=273540 RepID=A0A9Q0KQZ5_9MAGN|nr:hypothetical protein NE237_000323 [Protea cynaroides]